MNLYDYQTLKKDYNDELEQEFKLKLFKNKMQYVHEVQQSLEDVLAIMYIESFDFKLVRRNDDDTFWNYFKKLSEIDTLLTYRGTVSKYHLTDILQPYYYCKQFYEINKACFSGYEGIIENSLEKVISYYNSYMQFHLLYGLFKYQEDFAEYLTTYIIETENMLQEKGIYEDYSDIFEKIIAAYNISDYNLLLDCFGIYLDKYYGESGDESYYTTESSKIEFIKLCVDTPLGEEPILKKWNKFKGYIERFNITDISRICYKYKELHEMYCIKVLFDEVYLLQKKLIEKGEEKSLSIYIDLTNFFYDDKTNWTWNDKKVHQLVLRAIKHVYEKSDPMIQKLKDDLNLYCRSSLTYSDISWLRNSLEPIINYMHNNTDAIVAKKYDELDEYIDELSYDKIASYFEWFSMLISDIKIKEIDGLKKYVSLNPKYFK